MCNSTIGKYPKTEKESSWFTCQQNLARTNRRLHLVLVYPPQKENSRVLLQRNTGAVGPVLPPRRGRVAGGGNIQDVHSAACLKSKGLCNTLSRQGLDKGWEHVVSRDPKNPPAVKCPSWSERPGYNSRWNPNQQGQKLNDKRNGHLNNWWMGAGGGACSVARRTHGNVITLASDIILSPLLANFITQFSLSPRTDTSGPWLHLCPPGSPALD